MFTVGADECSLTITIELTKILPIETRNLLAILHPIEDGPKLGKFQSSLASRRQPQHQKLTWNESPTPQSVSAEPATCPRFSR